MLLYKKWTFMYQHKLFTKHRCTNCMHVISILSCVWEGESCSDDMFAMELTELGTCYSFNTASNHTLKTAKTGTYCRNIVRNSLIFQVFLIAHVNNLHHKHFFLIQFIMRHAHVELYTPKWNLSIICFYGLSMWLLNMHHENLLWDLSQTEICTPTWNFSPEIQINRCVVCVLIPGVFQAQTSASI